MKLDFTALTQRLTDLDKKAQELDEALKDVRVEINNVLWEIVEMKSVKNDKSAK